MLVPSSDSPAVIVARFLKANHYTQTLEAFLKEAGISEDAVTLSSDVWTIEKIIEEKKQFDVSLAFEKNGNEGNQGWTTPAPATAQSPEVSSISNVLCVRGDGFSNRILSTHADRKLSVMSGDPPYASLDTLSDNDSPLLSLTHVSNGHYLSTAMSGELTLRYGAEYNIVDKVRDHAKYAVISVVNLDGDELLVATAGWDQKVFLYHASHSKISQGRFFGSPIHALSLLTVPESLLFVRHPDTNVLYLIFSRRDSTFLYYYSITPFRSTNDSLTYAVSEAGRQNLAPHSNAWVAFTPSNLASHPSDPTLVAVATSHLPHMKLILVRLLFPSASPLAADPSYPSTQAAMGRADLAVQNREESAILLHVNTLAPQTPYSTPCVVWRPDGSGVYVNGDDGVIRGIEVKTGKVVQVLKGHEMGSKVRTLWSGLLGDKDEKREVLISGGFDKKVIVWECEEEEKKKM